MASGIPNLSSYDPVNAPKDVVDSLQVRPIPKAIQHAMLSQSNKLVDILHPRREPLPVNLPALGALRKQDFSEEFTVKEVQQQDTSDKKNALPFIEGDDIPNPFSYPDNIDDFLRMYEAEKEEKKKKDANVPPLYKGTHHYKQNQIANARVKQFMQPEETSSLLEDYKQVMWKANRGLHINHIQKVSRKMNKEYVIQRRQIYYLKRAIKARYSALEMLQKMEANEEKALKEYEWLTAFTKTCFEDFLRENDEETVAAAKRADFALKEKLEKAIEANELSKQITEIKSEIITVNENLRECKSYMKFLDDIAREIMRKDEEEAIRAYHREKQVKEEVEEFLKQGYEVEEAKAMVEEKWKGLYEEILQHQKNTGSLATGSLEFMTTLNRTIRRHLGLPESEPETPEETEEEEEVEEEEEQVVDKEDDDGFTGDRRVIIEKWEPEPIHKPKKPAKAHQKADKDQGKKRDKKGQDELEKQKMSLLEEDEDGFNEYKLLKSLDLVPGDEETDKLELASMSFTRPSQLLQIFSDMEETNLRLIQHSQASEETLERVSQQIFETRRGLNRRGRLLREEISNMETNIQENEERSVALKNLVAMFTGGNYDVKKQQKLYKILQIHIKKTYKAAIGNVDNHLNPKMMLTSVEKNFEDLMREIEAMPTDIVVQISRELDKERREMERLGKMNQRKAIQEARRTQAQIRANAPIQRKKGRPLLPRSHPPKIVIKLSQEELDKNAIADEFNYFFGP